jgi:hypothetical protein
MTALGHPLQHSFAILYKIIKVVELNLRSVLKHLFMPID